MLINAFQIAESIDLKKVKSSYEGTLHSYSSSDLFYTNTENRYLYISVYGVLVFCGYDELKISENIEYMLHYSTNPLKERLFDEFIVNQSTGDERFGHNEACLRKTDAEVLKIVMFNLGQSVALDFYQMQASMLLEETNRYTETLEKKGRLAISGTKLMKFIGKTMNVKNTIFDQLYVFDQPEAAWTDEYLSMIDANFRNTFDISIRFRSLEQSLQIVNENLSLFKDIMQHKRSNLLEIIIIALILVEVVNLFVEKIL